MKMENVLIVWLPGVLNVLKKMFVRNVVKIKNLLMEDVYARKDSSDIRKNVYLVKPLDAKSVHRNQTKNVRSVLM